MDLYWNTDRTVTLDPVPRRVRKLTGTRFAAVLGLNRWSTPFQVWCDVTGAYREPFEETVYTRAGKAIEPKQIAYMREAYGMDDLVDPTDVWGPDYFKKTWGNFFHHPVLGGMWDALLPSEDWDGTADGLEGHTDAVLEFKTTKRAEDWAEDVPEYYAMQAALYAWLLGCDDVIMVATFLKPSDYDDPESFEVGAGNTATYEFKVSERYPDFGDTLVYQAMRWWREHVEGGTSPAYDERADADVLRELRTAHLSPESDVDALLDEYGRLAREVAAVDAAVADKRRRMDAIKRQLRQFAQERIGDADTASFEHGGVGCRLSVTRGRKVDEAALKADGLWDKYSKETETTRFVVSTSKED